MLGLTESLPALVSRRFVAARESGDVIFSATQLAVLRSTKSGIDYQLRYCPALAKKPIPPAEKKSTEEKAPKRKNPFENPDEALLIADIPDNNNNTTTHVDHQDHSNNNNNAKKGHFLVLNKFPVIPNHFILATRPFKPQTDLLERDDLEAALACLKAWSQSTQASQTGAREEQVERKRLFAFFNSGEESGASQPHRHLQFVPVEDMRSSSSSWTPLVDHLSSSSPSSSSVHVDQESGIRYLPSLPFQHFALPLPPVSTEEQNIHAIYISLYRAALRAVGITDAAELSRSSGQAAISYNLAMTEDVMLLCPRRRENGIILTGVSGGATAAVAAEDNKDDSVSLNGTILAGTLMVKSEEQWDRLRGDVGLIDGLMAEVGFPYTKNAK